MNRSSVHAIDGMSNVFPYGSDRTLYQWSRGTLMLCPSLHMERPKSVLRRPSIRLLVAVRNPFSIEFYDGSRCAAHAMLLTSPIPHRRLEACDSGLAFFDFAIATPEYLALRSVFQNNSAIPLDSDMFDSLRSKIEQGLQMELNVDQVKAMVREAIGILAPGHSDIDSALDPRIVAVLQLINHLNLEDISLPRLAERVCLSPGRLRHLFQQQVGCPISYYAHTAAVWRALEGWARYRPLTEIAHEAGFYDLAHFSRSYARMFGYSPSSVAAHGQLKWLRDSD